MMADVYMFVVNIAAASVNSARNSSFLATKMFFLLINFALSTSSLILTTLVFNLLFTSYTFAIISLRISFLNTSLL